MHSYACAGAVHAITSNQAGSLLREDFTGKHATAVLTTGIAFDNVSVRRRHRQPLLDTSAFAFVSGLQGTGTISFTVPTGKRVDYVGMYVGSVDPYNFFSFYDKAGHVLPITIGAVAKPEISGTDIAVTLGGHRPSDLLDGALVPSLYVNFFFNADAQVTRLDIRQTNYATEFDNLVWRFAPLAIVPNGPGVPPVPAPGASALLGLGLLGLVARRRRCA